MAKFNLQENASKLRNPEEVKPKGQFEHMGEEQNPNTFKVYSELSEDLYSQLQDYAFWDRMHNQGEIIAIAIEEFLKGKEIKPRPQEILKRKRPGRPRKR
jgi:hypothetical protein